MESARAFGIRGDDIGVDDDRGDPRGTFTFTRLAAVPPLGTLRCCAFRPSTLVVVDAADEPIDLDDAAVDEAGSRPAMTPRVATAVDLPAAAEDDVAAVRAAPRAKAADSFDVLPL